jgi:hypothetical protein
MPVLGSFDFFDLAVLLAALLAVVLLVLDLM